MVESEPVASRVHWPKSNWEIPVNWFIAKKQYNSGIVEGLNALVKLRFRTAFGFRTFDPIEVALYHQPGKRPTRKSPTDSADEAKYSPMYSADNQHENATVPASSPIIKQPR